MQLVKVYQVVGVSVSVPKLFNAINLFH